MKKILIVFGRLLDFIYYFLLGGVAAARRKGVRVGENSRIYIWQFNDEPFLISIGSRTTVTGGVRLLTHDGSTSLVRNAEGYRYQRYGRISIGNDVFVGMNSIIMPGVTIQSRVVVGAGSVVTKDVPEGTVVAGNPARPLMDFESFRRKIEQTCPNDKELEAAVNYKERVKLALSIISTKGN